MRLTGFIESLKENDVRQMSRNNNKMYFLSIILCFINVYTFPNPKLTPYDKEI